MGNIIIKMLENDSNLELIMCFKIFIHGLKYYVQTFFLDYLASSLSIIHLKIFAATFYILYRIKGRGVYNLSQAFVCVTYRGFPLLPVPDTWQEMSRNVSKEKYQFGQLLEVVASLGVFFLPSVFSDGDK